MGFDFEKIAKRVLRMPLRSLRRLDRICSALSGRCLIVLAAHYYTRDPVAKFDSDTVRQNLAYLKDTCRILPLSEALERLEENKALPRRAVCLVVDDAALPFYHQGWPILEEAGDVPFSLAVIPGLIRDDSTDHLVARLMYGVNSLEGEEPRSEWLHRAVTRLNIDGGTREKFDFEELFLALRKLDRKSLESLADYLQVPDEDYMTWDQLKELRSTGRVDLVSHSMSHPHFRDATGEWLEWEMGRSKELLEQFLGNRVNTFVFPYGSYKEATEAARGSLKRNGYRFALLTSPGVVTPRSDRFRIPRVDGEAPLEMLCRNLKVWQRRCLLKNHNARSQKERISAAL